MENNGQDNSRPGKKTGSRAQPAAEIPRREDTAKHTEFPGKSQGTAPDGVCLTEDENQWKRQTPKRVQGHTINAVNPLKGKCRV